MFCNLNQVFVVPKLNQSVSTLPQHNILFVKLQHKEILNLNISAQCQNVLGQLGLGAEVLCCSQSGLEQHINVGGCPTVRCDEVCSSHAAFLPR